MIRDIFYFPISLFEIPIIVIYTYRIYSKMLPPKMSFIDKVLSAWYAMKRQQEVIGSVFQSITEKYKHIRFFASVLIWLAILWSLF